MPHGWKVATPPQLPCILLHALSGYFLFHTLEGFVNLQTRSPTTTASFTFLLWSRATVQVLGLKAGGIVFPENALITRQNRYQ